MRDENHYVPWRTYLPLAAKTFTAFYLATFSAAVYFIAIGMISWPLSILMVLLYLFVSGVCIQMLVKQLSLPALMLLVPIAPLVVLVIIVTMLPLLETILKFTH